MFDSEGNERGVSVAAGRHGLAQVALTRIALPVPILLLPPFILDAAEASRALGSAMRRSTAVRLGVQLTVIGTFLQCALPFAVALFPQEASLPAESLEPGFRDLRLSDGRRVDRLYFNKGL